MTDASDNKRDFFVSFNQADRAWATWIAWTLKEAGYSVWLQDWDFKGSIAGAMEQGHRASTHTLAVLSESYLASSYCRAEWEMRFHEDVDGTRGLIIPLRVASCEPGGLLGNLAWQDLFGLDEDAALATLLARTRQAIDPAYRPGADERRPRFPGVTGPFAPTAKPRFPIATNNLPSANPDFVGREQVLAELRRRLTSGQGPAVLSQAISGLGGVGKTQTALAYCYRHLADYTLVWWLRAEMKATLAADFTTLAAPLGLDPTAADQAKLIAGIRATLQASEGWLLVFDNVKEPGLPRAFLPSTGQGHVLITSRRTDWQGLARALPLEVMEEGEALQLLTSRSDPDALPMFELAEAKSLAKELGHLPLALAQARAYMAETGRGLAGYRRLLQASRPAVLARGRASPDYPASVAKTWQISIKAANRACAAARPLLELLAFFSADPLSMAVLGTEPAALPAELRGELERDEAIGALKRFSLLRAEAGTLTVHRLIQAVTRDGLDTATAKAQAGAAVQLVKAALPGSPQEHTNWPAIGALLPHALAAAEAAERLEAGLETAATVLDVTAIYHFARGAYAEAEPLYRRSLKIREKVLGPEHPDVAESLNNLAVLYKAQGRFAEAELLHQRALAIREKTLGPEHPDVARSLSNLAVLYYAQGRYTEAEPLLKRVQVIREKTLDPEHPDVARSLNNLVELYRAQGRSAEAEPLSKRALAIREKTLRPEHPHVAVSLNNLAGLYRAQGRFAEAEPLYQKAIAIKEKILGPEHPDVAQSLNNLAGLYRAQGRSAEAEPLYRGALLILKASFGENHPRTQTVQRNLDALVGSGQTLQTVVVRVLPNSQAAQIGLQSGDIIDSYGGERIVQSSSLVAAVRRPGDATRELIILRDGQTFHLQVAAGPLGIELQEIAAHAGAATEPPHGSSTEERR